MPQSATKNPRLPRRAANSPALRDRFGDLFFVMVTLVVIMFLSRCGLDATLGRIVLYWAIAKSCSGNPALQSVVIAIASLIKTLKS